MGHIRFWRRIKIFPGVYLNIGKNGISFSFGPRGIKYTKGTRGERVSVGLPGTGLYYVENKTKKTKVAKAENNDLDFDNLKNEIKGE